MQQAPCSCFVELPTRLNRLGNKSFENVLLLISKNHSDHGSVCFGLFIISLGFCFVLFSYLFVLFLFVCLFVSGEHEPKRGKCAPCIILEDEYWKRGCNCQIRLKNWVSHGRPALWPHSQAPYSRMESYCCQRRDLPVRHHFQLNAKSWCGLKSFCMFHSQIF